MASAGTVTVDFAAETAKFTAELKKVQGSLNSLQKEFTTLTKVGKVAAGLFAGGMFVSYTKAAFAAADATADAAERAGIAVESFSRLQYAAKQTDVEMQSLVAGVQRLQVTMSKAAKGNEEAQLTLAKFGVTAEQLRKLNLEGQLALIADHFKKIKDPADRTRLAVELFGRSAGPQLVPLLASGSAGIAALTKRADDLGITMREDTAKAIGAADKALKDFMDSASARTAEFLGKSILGWQYFWKVVSGPGDDAEGVNEQFKDLMEERFRIAQRIVRITERLGGDEAAMRVSGPMKQARADLAAVDAQLDALNAKLLDFSRTRQKALQAIVPEVPDVPAAAIEEIDTTATEKAVQGSKEAIDQIVEDAKEARERWLDEVAQINRDFLEESKKTGEALGAETEWQQEKQVEASRSAREAQVRDQTKAANDIEEVNAFAANTAMDNLEMMSGESEKAAKALVMINKGQAIVQAIQNTAVAVTKAYSQGGVYGIALAAGVAALGAAQVALIARSAYGQMSQVSRPSTAPIGTPATPAPTAPETPAADGESGQKALQVVINGNFFSTRESVNYLVEAIRDEIDSRDVVLFSPNSRQAQEIRAP